MQTYRSVSGSSAEDLFIELFSDTFGAEKAGYLYSQYPFFDIYQNSRFADFLIENGGRKVAIEIDDEASHNPKLISRGRSTWGCGKLRRRSQWPPSVRRFRSGSRQTGCSGKCRRKDTGNRDSRLSRHQRYRRTVQ